MARDYSKMAKDKTTIRFNNLQLSAIIGALQVASEHKIPMNKTCLALLDIWTHDERGQIIHDLSKREDINNELLEVLSDA
jgi:hypothetical protein